MQSTAKTIEMPVSEPEVKMRKCPKCGEVLPLTAEYFYKNDGCKNGFEPNCKNCKNKRREEIDRIKKQGKSLQKPPVLSLADMTDEMITNELKRRGYKGELKKVLTYTLSL